ncbi:MAG: thioredoxin family protein [Gammaproteobacteria bacterium]
MIRNDKRAGWLSRVTLAFALALVAHAAAATSEAFTEARFEALKAEGALVLVDVHASWCPTCAKQQKILDDYEARHPDVALHRLLVDFDEQKEWVKHFRAPRQSTLLLYRGDEQVWFSVAETRAEKVFEAINAAASAPR